MTQDDDKGVLSYNNADSASAGKTCGITFDGITSQAHYGCSEILLNDWLAGVDENETNGRVFNERWTNEVCRPGNATHTIRNANCKEGICQCNDDYYASERKGQRYT